MENIGVWSLILAMGIPTAVTGFFFWLLQRSIQKRDKAKELADAEHRRKEQEHEASREELMLLSIRGTNASLALCEATAKAVQRIPDAHCNGDMHAALDYASQVKHETRDFLSKQGIHAVV